MLWLAVLLALFCSLSFGAEVTLVRAEEVIQ
jgi:hypothetical protein